ncbi:MAG: hypothetical protein Q9219_001681 [cf. Caloplaca sp. 3 TL-2023]
MNGIRDRSTTSPSCTSLVSFYDSVNPEPDARGRSLASILEWSDAELEYCHDYIQTLFPLPERSPINPNAPIIDEDIYTAFRSNPALRDRLHDALVRMLRFYGFDLVSSSGPSNGEHGEDITQDKEGPIFTVKPSPQFLGNSKRWLTKYNHNHLRITRIVRSCRVLGLEAEARAFYDALVKAIKRQGKGVVSAKTLMFWQRAVERSLYLAPEADEERDSGKYWLWKVEFGDQADSGEWREQRNPMGI